MTDDELLAEQAEYYRARAPEYDRWFNRQGRYDRGEQETAAWFAEVDEVRAALASVPLEGADVLELAPGTGIWTEQLVGRVGTLTAVDSSAEMIELNRRRLGDQGDEVTFMNADLFGWEPEGVFDAVVFGFWISHIPEACLDGFLQRLAATTRPAGLVFFVDSRRDRTSTAADHILPGSGEASMIRRLDDGHEFRIIKNFWNPVELEARFRAAGIDMGVRETATYFQFGLGRRL